MTMCIVLTVVVNVFTPFLEEMTKNAEEPH